jgi:hypothetical protein
VILSLLTLKSFGRCFTFGEQSRVLVLTQKKNELEFCVGNFWVPVPHVYLFTARVNQHPPMHQLAVLSMEWAAFFHPVSINKLFFWFLTSEFFFFSNLTDLITLLT